MSNSALSSTAPAGYWVVVPAAGSGARMSSDIPKQYLVLGSKTILEHTLVRLLSIPDVLGIVVAIAEVDLHWHKLPISKHVLIHTVQGGAERADSVINGLDYLRDKCRPHDWVLVHDAARPCVSTANIAFLCESLVSDDVGGILAIPVCDTLKQVNGDKTITATVDRRTMWRAQTPQLFRHQLLLQCLLETKSRNEIVTDEASAVESCGYSPKVVEGREDNIKITRPDDLVLAAFILQQQESFL